MTTATQIIDRALKIAGVLGEGETATSEEAADGLVSLNDMVDSWNIERLAIYQIQEENFTLTIGDNSYTIGSGGDFNTTRPVKIENAFIRQNGNDYPVVIINNQAFDNITTKAVQSDLPDQLYYEPSFPLGTIHIYETPSAANDIYINSWKSLHSFSSLTTTLSLPPGYERALKYNLASELAPEYGMTLTAKAEQIATESKGRIKTLNAANNPLIARVDYGAVSNARRYNIYSDR